MDKSRRYCVFCKKITTFKRKKKEKHSSCSICNGGNSAKRRDKDVKVQKRYNQKVKNLSDENEIDIYSKEELRDLNKNDK